MSIDWEIGAAIAEIISAVAVIASLIYLARQIIQANRIARSSVVSDVQQKYNDFYSLILSNGEIAALLAKLVQPNYVPATDTENQQIETIVTLLAGIWFSTQASYDQGQIDENSYRVYSEDVAARLSLWPALKPHFRRVLERYPSAKDRPIFAPLFE